MHLASPASLCPSLRPAVGRPHVHMRVAYGRLCLTCWNGAALHAFDLHWHCIAVRTAHGFACAAPALAVLRAGAALPAVFPTLATICAPVHAHHVCLTITT